ncbi:MAG: flagellar biosynthesis anti-sigma factor FlgM [Peptococcia bacterium]
MRIYNQGLTGLTKVYEKQIKPGKVQNSNIKSKRDDLTISTEGKLWGMITNALRELPDPEPSANLAELKEAVSTGTYQVSSQEVAEKIWQDSSIDYKA